MATSWWQQHFNICSLLLALQNCPFVMAASSSKNTAGCSTYRLAPVRDAHQPASMQSLLSPTPASLDGKHRGASSRLKPSVLPSVYCPLCSFCLATASAFSVLNNAGHARVPSCNTRCDIMLSKHAGQQHGATSWMLDWAAELTIAVASQAVHDATQAAVPAPACGGPCRSHQSNVSPVLLLKGSQKSALNEQRPHMVPACCSLGSSGIPCTARMAQPFASTSQEGACLTAPVSCLLTGRV